MARVVVLGSSNTDLCVRVPRLPARGETVLGGPFWSGPGGKGANQAVAARRAGAEVVFLTAVGDDAFGRDALARYRAERIDVSFARVRSDAASGVAIIFVGDAGENVIGVAPGANASLSAADVDALPDAVFQPPGVLLASLEVPFDAVVRAMARAKRAGMTTVLNPAPVDALLATRGSGEPGPSAWGDLLRDVDVLTPNQSEAAALGRMGPDDDGGVYAAAQAVRRGLGIRHVVVTCGAEGCLFATDGVALRFPAHAVDPVDTVGAGDAFNGALAAALAEGRTLTEAVTWAGAAGALAVGRQGAQAASPHRAEIEQLAAQAGAPQRVSHDDEAPSG